MWKKSDDLAKLPGPLRIPFLGSLYIYIGVKRENGYKIPAGVEALIHIHDIHRNAKHFPNPEKFDPSRFFPENIIGRHPYTYIPFGVGPRNCIGQKYAMNEVKIILACIINRYKITAVEAPKEVKHVAEITLRPLNGIYVKLERRK